VVAWVHVNFVGDQDRLAGPAGQAASVWLRFADQIWSSGRLACSLAAERGDGVCAGDGPVGSHLQQAAHSDAKRLTTHPEDDLDYLQMTCTHCREAPMKPNGSQ